MRILTEWTPADLVALAADARDTGETVLPVRVDGALVLVGPLTGPGLAGCVVCAERARVAGLMGNLPQRTPLVMAGELSPGVLALVDTIVSGATRPGVQWAVRSDELTVSEHPVVPFGGCDSCAPLPDDAPARIAATPQPVPDETRLRADNPRTTVAALRRTLVDWRQGPVLQMSLQETKPLALAAAEVAAGGGTRFAGYGRAGGFGAAERVALFEAVERYTGMAPRGARTTVTGSYRDLAPLAVDPETLGLHDPEHHDHPAFAFAPYTPDTVTRWVHGWSLTDDRDVLLPEHVAYWHTPAADGRVLYESSNGCGLGNSLPEAILYGLFEVAERDAFLMAWYGRTPLTRVAVPDDPDTLDLVDRLDTVGHDLLLFDATNDFGVPVVMSMTLRREPHPDRPNALFAASAHPDPAAAVRTAAAEVVLDARNLAESRIQAFEPDRLRPMLDDPTLVTDLDHHVAVNALAEARDRYAFLLGEQDPVPWREIWPQHPPRVPDLGAYLGETVDRLRDAGLPVLAVDQSEGVIRDRLGLHAAKVVVPGSLPMTFGAVHRRTRGLRRLLEVPAALGRVPAPLRHDDLPLHPHPFP